jgi:hypothetical protein
MSEPQTSPEAAEPEVIYEWPEAETETPVATPDPASEPVAVAAPDPNEAFWNEKVNDTDLPPSQQGLTRREVWEQNKKAVAASHQAGFQKNEAERRAQAAELLAQTLANRLERPHQAEPSRPTANQLLGIASDQLITAEDLARLPELIEQTAQRIADEKLAPVTSRLVASEQHQLATASEAAQARVRASMKMEEAHWQAIRPGVAAVMMSAQLDPRDERNWAWATETYRASAAPLFPQQQRAEVTPGIVGNARPGATASPSAAKKAPTTGDPKLDAAIRSQVETWNANARGKKLTVEEMMEGYASDRAASAWSNQ